MNLRALVASSAFFSVAAIAQAVPCATGGPAGGVVTPEGECDGADAIFCGQDNNVVRIPCAALGEGAPVGSCEVYAGFGSWCAFNDGDACAFRDANDQTTTFACATDTSTCVSGVCAAGAFSCTPPAQGVTEDASCVDGAVLALGCNPWAQLAVVTCSGIDPASSCANDVCGNIPDGGLCAPGVVECVAGVDCVGATADAAGTCGGEPAEGEGEGEDDNGNGGNGRDDEPETPPSGCLNALGVVPAFAPLALVLIALRRRRRV